MLVKLTEIKGEYKPVIEGTVQKNRLVYFERTVYVNSSRVNYICEDGDGLTFIYIDDDLITVKEPLDQVARLLCV